MPGIDLYTHRQTSSVGKGPLHQLLPSWITSARDFNHRDPFESQTSTHNPGLLQFKPPWQGTFPAPIAPRSRLSGRKTRLQLAWRLLLDCAQHQAEPRPTANQTASPHGKGHDTELLCASDLHLHQAGKRGVGDPQGGGVGR